MAYSPSLSGRLPKTSYRRKKGKLEQVAIGIVTNVAHERMLMDKLIPAIKLRFLQVVRTSPSTFN